MTSGTNYRWVTAIVAALAAGLVVAIVAPRFVETDGTAWILTAVVAVAVGLGVALSTREKVDEGAHVKDDVLP